jgi:sec-independent protein translocase protein TatC
MSKKNSQAVAEPIATEAGSDDESRMSFTEHLGELRIRIIRAGVAVLVGAILCYILSNPIIEFLAYPISPIDMDDPSELFGSPAGGEGAETLDESGETSPPKEKLQWLVLNPLEIVFVKIKIAGYGGLFLAFPFVLYQICAFVFPGLKPKERRAVNMLIFGCAALAVAGVATAYIGVFPLVMPYIMLWVPDGVDTVLRLNETLGIIIKGIAAFAIAFQFPVVVLVLVYMDLLSPETLKKYRRVAIVGLAVAAAILTPPDPPSMIIMMAPLYLLYELSILLSYLIVRRKKATGDQA